MSWNFDNVPVRDGTNSIKFDLRKETFGAEDVIPMWVADMDFSTPDFIINALKKRLDHEILGYSFRPYSYFESIINWLNERHNWHVEKEWICFSPGIVPALNFCTLAFTSPGDYIVIQPPVYHPFYPAVELHGRKLLFNRLTENDGNWEMDPGSLLECAGKKPPMIIISNPHNPVGRSWSGEELARLVKICIENNILILSDEIHCDLVMPDYRHTPVATISPEAAEITITCVAPSKTFNIAGLSTSSVIISNPVLRKKFLTVTENLHIGGGNIFGAEASVAAYTYGKEWLDELLVYLDSNARYISEYCRNYIPYIIPSRLEATYLQWLDCRKMGMTGKELNKFFIHTAGIGMNEGSTFGPGGEGFMRMNIACPRKTLSMAMEKIEAALNSIR
ncbi:MAG: PatB family C-S lyase [Bacteroidales bacterium]|jgi:cystathionine beta-lyase